MMSEVFEYIGKRYLATRKSQDGDGGASKW